MKVILGFPNTEGYPIEFETVPEVGETIEWPSGEGRDDWAPAATYTVGSRRFVLNQLTGVMTPFLELQGPVDIDAWIEGMKAR